MRSVSFSKWKKRPSFWLLLLTLALTSASLFSCDANDDPWLANLLERGWILGESPCANIQPGHFAELDGVELYRSLTGLTIASRPTETSQEQQVCNTILEPTFVEEI